MIQNLRRRSTLLASLFARYMKGEIEESLWQRFLSMLDASETSPQERLALIAFMNDFLVERSVEVLQVTRLMSDESALQPRPAYAQQ